LDKVNKTKLLELLAEEVSRIGFSTIPITWEPIAIIPKLDFKVINLLKELIFTAWRANKIIYSFSIGA